MGGISTPSRVNSNSKKFASMPVFCMHDVMDFIVRWYAVSVHGRKRWQLFQCRYFPMWRRIFQTIFLNKKIKWTLILRLVLVTIRTRHSYYRWYYYWCAIPTITGTYVREVDSRRSSTWILDVTVLLVSFRENRHSPSIWTHAPPPHHHDFCMFHSKNSRSSTF